MRLLTCHHRDRLCAGLLKDQEVITLTSDITGLPADPRHDGPSVKTLLSLDRTGLEAMVRKASNAGERHAMDAVTLAPPIVDPDKIICVGLNYADHADETGNSRPTDPILFAKFRNALAGSGAPILLPPFSKEVDYEGELAVVIGRDCHRVAEADALGYVAGVMPLNDVTARDLQFRTSQWLPGKMIDGFAPCGPCLVTLDEIDDVQALGLTTTINREIVQQDTTGSMLFSVAELISYVSSLVTLTAGDVIATGTPGGVGFTRSPQRFLQPADTVQVQIAGIGTLTNVVAGPNGGRLASE